jgi:hypothetical protein
MSMLIIVFAALTLLAGITIMIDPEIIFATLRDNLDKLSLHIMAVVLRLIIGVLLIDQSGISRYPFVIEIIGWLSIAAALTFAVIGRGNFIRLMSWALSLARPFGRFGGAVAAAFGAFLIYAFV